MEYLLTFIEGIASFISPCMLPMVPIYISFFAGQKDNNKALINSIGFVVGFTIVFVCLSILTSAFGGVISSAIQYLKILFGILIIILGLNYMEILRIKFLNKSISFDNKIQRMNFFKAILFGMLFSVSWTPCVGAFLASALLLIAKEQDLIKGITLILIYSLGLGLPFIVSAILIEKLKSTFDFIKMHYSIIKKISGIILIVMGIFVMI